MIQIVIITLIITSIISLSVYIKYLRFKVKDLSKKNKYLENSLETESKKVDIIKETIDNSNRSTQNYLENLGTIEKESKDENFFIGGNIRLFNKLSKLRDKSRKRGRDKYKK